MRQRFLALLLATVMFFTCVPLTAFGATADITPVSGNGNVSLETVADSENSFYLVANSAQNLAVGFNSENASVLASKGSESATAWFVYSRGDYYYIKDADSGKVLEVAGDSVQKRTRMRLGDFDGSNRQLWRIEAAQNGFIIRPAMDSGFALNVAGNNFNEGNAIQLWQSGDNAHQFKFVLAASALSDEATDLERYGLSEEYAIVPCRSGWSAVDVPSDGSLTIWQEHRGYNQTWTLGKKGDYYYFKNKQYNTVVQVNGKAAKNEYLGTGNYDGSDKQLWSLESTNDGAYIIHSKLNYDLVWDLRGASVDNGTRIHLYPCHRGNNQRFRFMHLSTVEPMSEWGSRIHDCNVSDADLWDGSSTTDWYYDHKNENDYYLKSASDFSGFKDLVRNGTDMVDKTVHLMCDINLAGIQWDRIGTDDHNFRGSFNGHGHKIVGLSITTTDDNDGLFGVFSGSVICNLAVKGSVMGDDNLGGLVGYLDAGHLVNIYSEVSIINATDDCEGGLVGKCMKGGCIDHCTQNARVNNNDADPYRGGIAGYAKGVIRYCVNNATVNHNWDQGGGIAGALEDGRIEYCANHGTIGGGGNSERIGGIVGEVYGSGYVFGCFNDGKVYSTDDDYIGGICGYLHDYWRIEGCINVGRVYGDDQIGGILGYGRAYRCINIGKVTGDDDVGGIGGDSEGAPNCYVLHWSAPNIDGGSDEGGSWVTAEDIISGKLCWDINDGDNEIAPIKNDYAKGMTTIFTQNIGSDPYPTFGTTKVSKSGENYVNAEYKVNVDCNQGYGSVTGAGKYKSGKVTLKATPAPGCVFEHFEVKSAKVTTVKGWDGKDHDGVEEVVTTYDKDTITLTDNIKQSYTVKAVFSIFDDTPDDMKVTVKLEVECTDDVGGWNSDNLPIELIDSAGESHLWEADRHDLDDEGDKASHTFDLGTASPVAVYATPDFGGGFTFRDYALKCRMWVNGSGEAMESGKVTIRSWPFISSKWGSDYMSISFENYGNSKVGNAEKDEWTDYDKVKDAWNKARSGKDLTIRLESAWLLDGVLELTHGQSVTLDLNGYPIIRTIKKTQDDGELIKVGSGSTLTIVDSNPKRPSCGNFTGGSIQGGRSDDTAGLIECNGTLVMTGGTLYNGGTTDKGGAIKLNDNGTAALTNVLISDCWSNKAITYQNEGGAIYMRDKAKVTLKNCSIRNCKALDYGGGIYLEDDDNELSCENVNLISCTALENFGGGVHQDRGKTEWIGGTIKNCKANDDDGGGFYQDDGEVYMENVKFVSNSSSDNGGAFYCNTDDKTWFVGCTFNKNSAGANGGALYFDNNYLYMADCSVTANKAGDDGGALYIDSAGSIDVAGKMVIKNNDGSGSMDNLVLEDGAYVHDQGLEPGSDIHLRSYSNGNVMLSSERISEYQLGYFHADYGKLSLTDTKDVDTQIRATVFTDGKAVIIIGAILMILIAAGTVYYFKKGRKEEHNEKN